MQNFLTLRSKHVRKRGTGVIVVNFFLILLIDSNKEDFLYLSPAIDKQFCTKIFYSNANESS